MTIVYNANDEEEGWYAMRIAGLQKLTLLDYPQKTAATIFFAGCNLRCPYCHNAALVTKSIDEDFSVQDILAFLDTRQGLLDGVCITGGEPLLQPDLATLCAHIKKRSFAIKLDTNGTLPKRLADLVRAGLVDYVALDVKHCPSLYGRAVGMEGFDSSPVQESVRFLLEGSIPHEFRTTVVRGIHDEESLAELAQHLMGAHAWYLQNFVDSPSVLAGQGVLQPFPQEELERIVAKLRLIVPCVQLRGAD